MIIGISYVGSKLADVFNKKNANNEFATKEELNSAKSDIDSCLKEKAEKDDLELVRADVKMNRVDINKAMDNIVDQKVEMKGLSKDVEKILELITTSNDRIKDINDNIKSINEKINQINIK